MAHHARNIQISRRSWLLAGLSVPLFRARAAIDFSVSFDGDNLHLVAPSLHFLSGKPLERLKDGATVVFLSQFTLFSDNFGTLFRRGAPERLIVSYDLWEEKFSITVPGIVPRPAVFESATAAESWCLGTLAISASGLAPSRPFWLRFDLRALSPKEASSVLGEAGISLSRVLDLLSRRPGTDERPWMLQTGPLRLNDLVHVGGRGTRNG